MGTGSANLGVDARSRAGAETGGATTSVVCVMGVRELAKSRCSRGAGATTFGAIGLEERIFSCATLGAGAIGVWFRGEELRLT